MRLEKKKKKVYENNHILGLKPIKYSANWSWKNRIIYIASGAHFTPRSAFRALSSHVQAQWQSST